MEGGTLLIGVLDELDERKGRVSGGGRQQGRLHR